MIGLEQCWLHFSWCYQGEPNVCKLILGHTTLSFGSILWLCSLRTCQWVHWCIPSYIGASTFSYYLFFSCIAKSTEPSKQIFLIWRNEIVLWCSILLFIPILAVPSMISFHLKSYLVIPALTWCAFMAQQMTDAMAHCIHCTDGHKQDFKVWIYDTDNSMPINCLCALSLNDQIVISQILAKCNE